MTNMTNMTTKQRATLLLRKYDDMRREIRSVERDLAKACTDYGRECGIWGFSKDMFRIRIENEDRARIEAQADQAVWEQNNA